MLRHTLVLISFLSCFSIAQQPSSASLVEALEFVPLETRYVHFTNWELIKTYEGLENLSGQDTFEQRREFYKTLSEHQAVASLHGTFARLYAADYTEMWGWDSVDLRWEITLELNHPSVYVLALRKNFDMTGLEQLLRERDYQLTSFDSFDLYSHELEVAEWSLGELSILNIAILRDKNMLVLSSSPEGVQTVLGAAKQNASKFYQGVLGPLGNVAAATLSLDTLCSDLSFAAMMQELMTLGVDQDTIDKMIEEIKTSPLHPYFLFALGYRYENNQPLGLMVMDYGDTKTAQGDLEARRKAAEEGVSLRVNLPYRESVFELAEARVEDTAVVLELHPVNDQPRRLFEMLYSRDMTFAGCP